MARRLLIATVAAAAVAAFGSPVARASDQIYWGNFGNSTISFANLDGSGSGNQLGTGTATVAQPNGLAYDSAKSRLFWANYGNNTGTTIGFANLADGGGSDLNTAPTVPAGPNGPSVDRVNGKVYWANYAGSTIAFANLDNSGGGGIFTPPAGTVIDQPSSLVVDPRSERMYWANAPGTGPQDNTIYFARLDGSSGGQVDTTGATVNNPNGLAVDRRGGRLFWANSGDDAHPISYASLLLGTAHDLPVTGATAGYAYGLALDTTAGRVYWANETNDTISYAKLDGSGGGNQLGLTGATPRGPGFPILLKKPTNASAPLVSGGRQAGTTLSCTDAAWQPDASEAFLWQAPRKTGRHWTRDGKAVSGATGPTYKATRAGSYRCVGTASNPQGAGTSQSEAHKVFPDTKITKPRHRGRRASFSFKARGGASRFECRLRGPHRRHARYHKCHSPKRYRKLRPGRYTFQVRARAAVGADPSPAKRRFRVKRS